jgi:hypothetical protein
MGLTNKAVEGKLGHSCVRKSTDDGKGCVPGQPRRSFQRLHHPILQLANSPYLVRKAGIGRVLGGREGMERTLITMDEEKVHRNLSGENEWRERDGIRGEDGT